MNEETTKNEVKMTKNSNSSNKPIIDIDTKISIMLQYDQEGKMLTFDTDPGKFKELGRETLRELSNENRLRYSQAKEINKLLNEEAEEDQSWKDEIKIDEQYASPTERLSVKNGTKGYSYYNAAPGNIGKYQKLGYHIVPDSDPASIGMSGSKKIGTLGRDELVLMRTTEENKKKIDEAKREKIKVRKGAAEQSGRDLGMSLGIETKDIE